MESAGLRKRDKASTDEVPTQHVAEHEIGGSLQPPRYTIDLSLPPRKRYQHIAKDFRTQVTALPVLFDDLVRDLHPRLSVKMVKRLARLFLRRVYSKEETEEIRGIQEATGVELYLIVAFNVLLDLLMGCTSGGARVKSEDGSTRMLHFRTMDWGMDPLRKVIIRLDFVEKAGKPVIASSITYAGYVGVLTGVRRGLSMSLNFRPNHDASSRLINFKFYFHQLLVLLGFRPAISSILRQCLTPSRVADGKFRSVGTNLEKIEQGLPGIATTAAYLIFSDGERTITLEKDHKTALVRSASDFIVKTNHDLADESSAPLKSTARNLPSKTLEITGMEDIVEESISRKEAALGLWEKATKKSGRDSTTGEAALSQAEVSDWLCKYPITNEETHFGTIMDAIAGQVRWFKWYPEPLKENDFQH